MRSNTTRAAKCGNWLWALVLAVLFSTAGVMPAVSAAPAQRADLATPTDPGAMVGSQAGGYELWVTNQRRNSIQVVRDEAVVDEIALAGVARVPHIFRFSPSGRYAYLASVGMP